MDNKTNFVKEAKHDLEVAYYSVEAFHFCVGNFVS